MVSGIFILPIVALAVYSTYRYVKNQTSGSEGKCGNCPSHKHCQMNATMKKQHLSPKEGS